MYMHIIRHLFNGFMINLIVFKMPSHLPTTSYKKSKENCVRMILAILHFVHIFI